MEFTLSEEKEEKYQRYLNNWESRRLIHLKGIVKKSLSDEEGKPFKRKDWSNRETFYYL